MVYGSLNDCGCQARDSRRDSRRDNGRVYLAGYSGEVLIDNGGILSLFEEEGRAIEPRNWLLTLISATFF